MNKLQRQFLSSTTTLLHMSAPTPKKAISKDDYTLAHYLIFTKLVSAEADALKNLYLKIGSTSPSLRLASKQTGCMIQMPQLICASILNIKLVFVTTLLQSCIRSVCCTHIFPRHVILQHVGLFRNTCCIIAEIPLY